MAVWKKRPHRLLGGSPTRRERSTGISDTRNRLVHRTESLNRIKSPSQLVRNVPPHSHVPGRPAPSLRSSPLLIEAEEILFYFRMHIEARFGVVRCFQQSFQEMDIFRAGRICQADFEILVPRLLGFNVCVRDLRRLFLLADRKMKGFITISDWLRIKP